MASVKNIPKEDDSSDDEHFFQENIAEKNVQILKDDDIIMDENEQYIFNPFNSQNIQIGEKEIYDVLRRYGVNAKLNNVKLYQRAFVHKSYVKRPALENNEQNIIITQCPPNCMELKTKSNERLEFLGDGVLECIIKYYLYRRFPKENEGFMTEKKIALVKNEAIGKLAYEMRLHKWYILSKHAEEKNIRTNHKKLGCLFESFLGALFLDMNKIEIHDEDGWFKNVFVTGPGFQIAQSFVENIIETHVDWTELISNDDNYKNILQVKIQKEFKVTPHYLEISHNIETGYHMGVYICLGQQIHEVNHHEALDFKKIKTFEKIHEMMETKGKIFVFLSDGLHKIKKKAEQIACEKSLMLLS
jgi:dsRNA-specific ribonuclease